MRGAGRSVKRFSEGSLREWPRSGRPLHRRSWDTGPARGGLPGLAAHRAGTSRHANWRSPRARREVKLWREGACQPSGRDAG